MARTRQGIIAALDIGTSKVCCFIADRDADGTLRVRGLGHQVSRGLKSGQIVDMESAETSILNAVHTAEQMAGAQIERVVVNVSCGRPASRNVGIEVAIDGHAVGDGDMRRALDHGRRYQVDSDRAIVHSIPTGFMIDGNPGIKDPRGMFGERLGVEMHIVTAGASAIRNLVGCVERTHLDIETLTLSPYASALACLVEDERELGVTLIDMGGGTTTIAVYHDGELVFTDHIPVGGIHVTNDIAHGMSTPVVHAERMKTLYGSAVASPIDEHDMIDVPRIGEDDRAQPNHVPKSLLTGIIQPRLEEIFELVRSRLEMSGFARAAGRRVVLTGGASQLAGVRDLAALVLDKQIRMGRPIGVQGLADAAGGPAFSVAAGLLIYAAEKSVTPAPWTGLAPADAPSGLIGRFGHWLRANF